MREVYDVLRDQLRYPMGLSLKPTELSGRVIADQFRGRMPGGGPIYTERNLFSNARRYFQWSGRFVELSFEEPPDILHFTYQLPLRAKSTCNVYTIHDLVPLRLPFATGDNKRRTLSLLAKIAAEADHIVTVSENSKRDIIELLGVDEARITMVCAGAVEFPGDSLERSEDVVAEQLRGTFRAQRAELPAVFRRAGAEEEMSGG